MSATSAASTSTIVAGSSSNSQPEQQQIRMPGKPNMVLGGNYGETVDTSRWVVLYPPYIDCTLKEKEGRKIAKEKCVEKPTMVEIFDCAQLLGLQTALETDKAYCRDYWQRGRIRVRLFKNASGDEVQVDKVPVRDDIPNRRTLYENIAKLIPEHRSRTEHAKKGGGKVSNGGGGSAGGSGGKTGAKPGAKPGAKGGTGGKAPTQPKKKKKGKR